MNPIPRINWGSDGVSKEGEGGICSVHPRDATCTQVHEDPCGRFLM